MFQCGWAGARDEHGTNLPVSLMLQCCLAGAREEQGGGVSALGARSSNSTCDLFCCKLQIILVSELAILLCYSEIESCQTFLKQRFSKTRKESQGINES
jgi:hypothetical protein